MEYTLTLIDKAAEMCGGQNALAKKLGFSSGTLSDMKHGRKAVSPATAAELADIAGIDVDYAIKLAVLESVKGTRREAKLREILGKGLAAGAVAMLATSYSSAANASLANEAQLSPGLNNVYIVSFWMKRLRQALSVRRKLARFGLSAYPA